MPNAINYLYLKEYQKLNRKKKHQRSCVTCEKTANENEKKENRQLNFLKYDDIIAILFTFTKKNKYEKLDQVH